MSRQPPDFRHPDEVLAFVDEIRERNRQMVERYERFTEQTGALTGEGWSPDGTVRAEVDQDGLVAAVDIPDAALRRGGHLAMMIMTAIEEAQAARALKLAELGSALGGPDVTGLVRESIPAAVRDAVDQRHAERR